MFKCDEPETAEQSEERLITVTDLKWILMNLGLVWVKNQIRQSKANALMVSRSEEMRTVPKQNISSAVKKLSKVPNEIERQSVSVYVMVGKMSSNCVIIRRTKMVKNKTKQNKTDFQSVWMCRSSTCYPVYNKQQTLKQKVSLLCVVTLTSPLLASSPSNR